MTYNGVHHDSENAIFCPSPNSFAPPSYCGRPARDSRRQRFIYCGAAGCRRRQHLSYGRRRQFSSSTSEPRPPNSSKSRADARPRGWAPAARPTKRPSCVAAGSDQGHLRARAQTATALTSRPTAAVVFALRTSSPTKLSGEPALRRTRGTDRIALFARRRDAFFSPSSAAPKWVVAEASLAPALISTIDKPAIAHTHISDDGTRVYFEAEATTRERCRGGSWPKTGDLSMRSGPVRQHGGVCGLRRSVRFSPSNRPETDAAFRSANIPISLGFRKEKSPNLRTGPRISPRPECRRLRRQVADAQRQFRAMGGHRQRRRERGLGVSTTPTNYGPDFRRPGNAARRLKTSVKVPRPHPAGSPSASTARLRVSLDRRRERPVRTKHDPSQRCRTSTRQRGEARNARESDFAGRQPSAPAGGSVRPRNKR